MNGSRLNDWEELVKLLNTSRRVFTTPDYNKTYSVEFLLKNGTCQTREVTATGVAFCGVLR